MWSQCSHSIKASLRTHVWRESDEGEALRKANEENARLALRVKDLEASAAAAAAAAAHARPRGRVWRQCYHSMEASVSEDHDYWSHDHLEASTSCSRRGGAPRAATPKKPKKPKKPGRRRARRERRARGARGRGRMAWTVTTATKTRVMGRKLLAHREKPFKISSLLYFAQAFTDEQPHCTPSRGMLLLGHQANGILSADSEFKISSSLANRIFQCGSVR